MTATHKNFLKTTISAVASSGLGAFTISTASSGYRTFGSGDDGKTFDGVTIKEGTSWEVRDGCVYTHSGTSLSRGTLMDSSTGSAITFTSAAVVEQNPSADWARRMESAGLNTVLSSADANITMTVGTLHGVDISGYTADRTATLPAVAAVDDRCGLYITTGDDTYELLYTAASGDTLDGTAGGTEKSRLYIAGELVIFRCIVANTTWAIEVDKRKFESCRIDTNGTTASHAAGSATKISAELATVTSNPQGIWDSTNKRFTPRRTGRYLIHGHLQMALMAVSKSCVAQIYRNGATNIGGGTTAANVVASGYPEADAFLFYDVTTVGDYFELFVFNGDTSARNTSSANVYFEATRIKDSL